MICPRPVPWEPWKTHLALAFSFLSALHVICLCLPPCSGENNVMANINVPLPPKMSIVLDMPLGAEKKWSPETPPPGSSLLEDQSG